MKTLICGSMAYDVIMSCQDRFKNHILPEHIHVLNVSFLVPELRRNFGGCAGNIAYNLKLLGGEPLIMATMGHDASAYFAHLDALGIARTHIGQIADAFTAQAFITTDLDGNQITAFHPGAMNFSANNHVADAANVDLGIISPDSREGMLQHARELSEAHIPFVFDPGQNIMSFSGEELIHFMKLAKYACFNDYEARLCSDKTGCSVAKLAAEVDALIVTQGAEGSRIYTNGECLTIPPVKARAELDPTGCGDAYRAGLLYGLAQGWGWRKIGQLASLMGAIKIAEYGCQNHKPSRAEIAAQFKAAFGETL